MLLYLFMGHTPHASRPHESDVRQSVGVCKLYGSADAIRACAGGGRVVGACVGLPVAGWVGSLGWVGRSGGCGGRWACRWVGGGRSGVGFGWWVGGRLVVGVGDDAGV